MARSFYPYHFVLVPMWTLLPFSPVLYIVETRVNKLVVRVREDLIKLVGMRIRLAERR